MENPKSLQPLHSARARRVQAPAQSWRSAVGLLLELRAWAQGDFWSFSQWKLFGNWGIYSFSMFFFCGAPLKGIQIQGLAICGE